MLEESEITSNAEGYLDGSNNIMEETMVLSFYKRPTPHLTVKRFGEMNGVQISFFHMVQATVEESQFYSLDI